MNASIQSITINVSNKITLINTNHTPIDINPGTYLANHCPDTVKTYELSDINGNFIAKVEINIIGNTACIS